MKKKFIAAIILTIFCTASFSAPTYAALNYSDPNTIQTIENDFIIETIIENEYASNDLSLLSASTVKKKKTVTYKSTSGTILWSVTVHGTFSYNGTSAKCTSSSVSVTCPSSNWKISKKSSGKSGATATATASAKQYQNNSYLRTVTKTVKLTCSKTGKFS
mgnify:CR=1 FL=1